MDVQSIPQRVCHSPSTPTANTQHGGINDLADLALDFFGGTKKMLDPPIPYFPSYEVAVKQDISRTSLPNKQQNNDNQNEYRGNGEYYSDSYSAHRTQYELFEKYDVNRNGYVASSRDNVNTRNDGLSMSSSPGSHITVPIVHNIPQNNTSEPPRRFPKFQLNRPAPLDMSLIQNNNSLNPWVSQTPPQIETSYVESSPNQILFENVCKFFTDTPTVWFSEQNQYPTCSTESVRKTTTTTATSISPSVPAHRNNFGNADGIYPLQSLLSSPPESLAETGNNILSNDPAWGCTEEPTKTHSEKLNNVCDSFSPADTENGFNSTTTYTRDLNCEENSAEDPGHSRETVKKGPVARQNYKNSFEAYLYKNLDVKFPFHHWFVMKVRQHGLSLCDFLDFDEEYIIMNSRVKKNLINCGVKEKKFLNDRERKRCKLNIREKMQFVADPIIHPKKCFKSDCFYSIIGFRDDEELSRHVYHFHFDELHHCYSCQETYYVKEDRNNHLFSCHDVKEEEIDISKEIMLAKWGHKDPHTFKLAEYDFLRKYQARIEFNATSIKTKPRRSRRLRRKAVPPRHTTLSSASREKLEKQLSQL